MTELFVPAWLRNFQLVAPPEQLIGFPDHVVAQLLLLLALAPQLTLLQLHPQPIMREIIPMVFGAQPVQVL